MARDPYKYFRVEARDLTDQLGQSVLELERAGSGGEVVPRLLRLAHTLKGAARVVRQPEIADQAHTIEDVLAPFRETTTSVPKDSIETLLKLLDNIATKVASLTAPDPAAPPASPSSPAKAEGARPAPEDAFRAVRTDVNDVDDLLDGITETNSQLGALREVAANAVQLRRLSDLVSEQLVGRIGVSGGSREAANLRASVAMLRTLSANIERSIVSTHERVDRELREVRNAAEQMRLVPAGALFSAFERTARDSAYALGKEVTFTSQGGDIRLDAQIVRMVQDAVVQLIRNAVAHGIETRRDRIALSKPPLGRISVTVRRSGRKIIFRCEDDGRGIDVAALRTAAIQKGRSAAELDRLDADGLIHVLLQGGISTSPTISEVAGRGIGMDVVRESVERLGAELLVVTELGQGTRFDLVVPLSVSSVEVLVLEAGSVRASLPLSAVSHSVRLDPANIIHTSIGETIVHEGKAIPLVTLNRLLGQPSTQKRSGSLSAVVVSTPSGFAAISVGRLLGTAGIVFRTLPEFAPASPVIGGASLDADGNPLLMLDPEGIVAAALQVGEAAPVGGAAQLPLLVIDDSLTTRMLEQSILESAGYEVDIAMSAEEGLERARQREYALILCDVEMPGMDGFSFIEQIRREPALRDIPAILVTSRNAPEDKRRGRDAGAQDYVVKSEFDQAELLDRIRQLVAR